MLTALIRPEAGRGDREVGVDDRPVAVRLAHVHHGRAIVLRTVARFGPNPLFVAPALIREHHRHVAVDGDAQIAGGVALVPLKARAIEIPHRQPVLAAVVLVTVQVDEHVLRIVAPPLPQMVIVDHIVGDQQLVVQRQDALLIGRRAAVKLRRLIDESTSGEQQPRFQS